jgi:hypothetical protein
MKIITIVWLVLGALLVVLHRVAHYWLGYAESPAAFAVTDPFFGVMAEFVLFLLFIFPAIGTELAKKGRAWSFIGLLGFWPVVLLTFFLVQTFAIPGGEVTMRGLRDRVMDDYSLDDLRHFAKDVNDGEILKDEDLVSQSETSGLTDSQRAALAQLVSKYPLMHWLDDDEKWFGPSLLDYGQDNVVAFEWGGDNRGRWGCSISVDGSKNEPVYGSPMKVLRVSDDIYFYFRP